MLYIEWLLVIVLGELIEKNKNKYITTHSILYLLPHEYKHPNLRWNIE